MTHINYKVLAEKNLLVVCQSGTVTMDDIMVARAAAAQNQDYSPHFNQLIDFSEASLSIKPREVKALVKFSESISNDQVPRRIAIITVKPFETMASMLLLHQAKSLPFAIQVFSTLGAAMKFLGYPADDQAEIEQTLAELKDSQATSQ